ncbi:radical SAM family heme chaperone HemW [Candidatus Profftia tarda]|uniref:Heme chaperone HemW n=1 Tax=Candidatus Profftia tarda TaxID=1177216 RepID=A0A8E4GHT1_9ENTR|nr:radical SAM family heme chaperone HemW [Candidatus Profftia tarda]CAD6509986.1 Oxygen-independent coproporphyrinogen-III oxidase-like protein YggW [Candidatus Profftia tarda]
MFKLPPLSLYIHFPWCLQRCPYCDFNVHLAKDDIPSIEYVNHLLADLDNDLSFTSGREISTIFIGGGTPSLLSVKSMHRLMNGIRMRLPLAVNAEVTMEANPGTMAPDRLSSYQSAGINRISIGVQSFNKDHLKTLGCMHSPEDSIRALLLAQGRGLRSFNLDLMYGLLNQSLEEAIEDLRQAIELNNPPHLSWYQLTIEANTLLASRPPQLPNEDTIWNILQNGDALLSAAGYQQYEISAYAKSGYQCDHNLNYWRFGDYLGIGCGSHGKITFENSYILRTVKTRHPRGYMQGRYLHKQDPVDSNNRPFEFFMNRFRLLEPMPRLEFQLYTGLGEEVIREQIDHAIAYNYIIETDESWQITKHGKFFFNSLLELFL